MSANKTPTSKPADSQRIKTLTSMCEANVTSFTNDQMSEALVMLERARLLLWKAEPHIENTTIAVIGDRHNAKLLLREIRDTLGDFGI